MTPQARLLAWYAKHKRDLPWRHTRDPYRIVVSEIMLQQTQVDRVLAFYERWLEAFPNEQALVAASLDHIHRLWKGLGYPSRAERLRRCCAMVFVVGWCVGHAEEQALPGLGAPHCWRGGLPSLKRCLWSIPMLPGVCAA